MRPPLAPQLRGRVTPRILRALAELGFTIHRVGQAAYVHRDRLHLLFGVWPRRAPAPPWASRLGRPSDGYCRRVARCELEQRGRLMGREVDGRFAYRRPWWRVPGPVVYRFEAHRASWYEAAWGRI